VLSFLRFTPTGVEASAAQNAPVTTTCLQCGSILPRGARACTFCDSRLESPANPSGGNSTLSTDASVAWRGEVSQRLASYRARRGKTEPDENQSELPFECAPQIPVPGVNIAVAEQPANAATLAAPDDFSFTLAIGRTANRKPADEAQMFIDVSLPVEPAGSNPRPQSHPQAPATEPPQDLIQHHTGQYPVAPIEERRLAGLIDAACLFFACGGFLALFGSLGGQFTFSKLNAAVYATSFAIVYLQYFALFTVFGGTTPGMMLRGLRVVDLSGEEPSPRQLLLRAAGYMLSAGTFFLGFLWVQWDEDELAWHDRISRTYLSSSETVADSDLGAVAHNH
jgi:uncharacterized RDD family membrane protein YckC